MVKDAAGEEITPGCRVVYFKVTSGSLWSTIRTVYEVDPKLGVKMLEEDRWSHENGQREFIKGTKPSIQWAQPGKMVVIS